MAVTAHALWITEAGTAKLKDTPLNIADGMIDATTLYTGISRGTERLVFQGQVPPSEFETMRAPFQDGSFAFPVKYGYSAVGVVQTGPRAGETVFALCPHQTRFAVPADMAIPVPSSVPPERVILAANMETALNIVWDAGVSPGDQVVVVGAGVVGALVGYLCAKMPGSEVCLVDIDAGKANLAHVLGCQFASPSAAPKGADVVVHTSATSEGLATALGVAGTEATIVEASWFGTRDTTVPLGAAFHQKRLRIVSSQVGRVPSSKSSRWTHRRRLEKALSLLADPALDILISGESAFDTLAENYGEILADPSTLCHRVAYSTE